MMCNLGGFFGTYRVLSFIVDAWKYLINLFEVNIGSSPRVLQKLLHRNGLDVGKFVIQSVLLWQFKDSVHRKTTD